MEFKDKKTITISTLIAGLLVSAAMVVPGLFDEPKYFCDERPELGLIECDNFSKYVADNGKCIRNDNTNLICKSGWSLVINDEEIPEEEIVEKLYNGTVGTPQNKYRCNSEGCIII